MVELCWIHEIAPKCWGLHIFDGVKVILGSPEQLEMASGVRPQFARLVCSQSAIARSSWLSTAYGGASMQVGSVQNGGASGLTGG